MAARLSSTWRASSATEPPTSSPVWGDRAICPDIYSVLPALMAWLYGPIGAGAWVVWIISLRVDISYGCRTSVEKKPLDNLVADGQQKQDDGDGIDGMHYPQVETGRSVGVLFSEKIHVVLLHPFQRPLRPLIGGGYFIVEPAVFEDFTHGIIEMACDDEVAESPPFVVNRRG